VIAALCDVFITMFDEAMLDPAALRWNRLGIAISRKFPDSVQLTEAGVAVALRIALDVLVPQDRQRDVLALELAMDARPLGLDLTPVTALGASVGERPDLERGIGHPSGSVQLRPAAQKRLIVARTVDAATPIRLPISRVGTLPTNFNEALRALGAWSFSLLPFGPSFGRAKGADLSRSAKVPDPGEIIPEWWATSSRNDGRN
jgi:hypothetical protein